MRLFVPTFIPEVSHCSSFASLICLDFVLHLRNCLNKSDDTESGSLVHIFACTTQIYFFCECAHVNVHENCRIVEYSKSLTFEMLDPVDSRIRRTF